VTWFSGVSGLIGEQALHESNGSRKKKRRKKKEVGKALMVDKC
jgi:hypothetical protein